MIFCNRKKDVDIVWKSLNKHHFDAERLHGDMDQVVPSSSLLEAKDFLIRNNVEVETHMIKNCGHNISIEASSIALNYIKKNFEV